MSDFKLARMLAPTDGSAFSQKAVNYARELAKQFGAELHVLPVRARSSRCGRTR
jgi:nucleotide-binding universal stress UspA family protein